MHVGAHLLSRFQKLDGMLQFELKVMVIRIGAETDFFDNRLLCVGFNLLLLLLLLVDKLAIINDFADGRHSLWRYFYQIQLQFIGKFQCFTCGVYPLLYIVAYQSYLRYPDVFIDTVLRFLFSKWR